jgi:hypothetical protein
MSGERLNEIRRRLAGLKIGATKPYAYHPDEIDEVREFHQHAEADVAYLLRELAERDRLREALEKARDFIDNPVRAWMPNEHTNCGIDSGCSHGAWEREVFEELDRQIDAINAALRPAQAKIISSLEAERDRLREALETMRPHIVNLMLQAPAGLCEDAADELGRIYSAALRPTQDEQR